VLSNDFSENQTEVSKLQEFGNIRVDIENLWDRIDDQKDKIGKLENLNVNLKVMTILAGVFGLGGLAPWVLH
jgi:hypothetical protein